MSFAPRNPFSEVVDLERRFTPEWYSWLQELCVIVSPPPTTIGLLPSAALVGAGARAFVLDATATTFLSVVVGGGTNAVPVVSNGTDWLIG